MPLIRISRSILGSTMQYHLERQKSSINC